MVLQCGGETGTFLYKCTSSVCEHCVCAKCHTGILGQWDPLAQVHCPKCENAVLRLSRTGLWGMGLRDVHHNGDCLFEVISILLFGTPDHHAWVRAQLIQWYANHWPSRALAEANQLQIWSPFGNALHYDTPAEYLADMGRKGCHGGIPELVATCYRFGVRLMAYILPNTADDKPAIAMLGRAGPVVGATLLQFSHFSVLQVGFSTNIAAPFTHVQPLRAAAGLSVRFQGWGKFSQDFWVDGRTPLLHVWWVGT